MRGWWKKDFHMLPLNSDWPYPFISMLSGHRELEDPAWDPEPILARYARESQAFLLRKAPYELYPRKEQV